MATKLYKIHLKREGKTNEGVQRILLRDFNNQHKQAEALVREVLKPWEKTITMEIIERAVEVAMREPTNQ